MDEHTDLILDHAPLQVVWPKLDCKNGVSASLHTYRQTCISAYRQCLGLARRRDKHMKHALHAQLLVLYLAIMAHMDCS